ncbi:MAG: site-2 protease family protein [Defluviitaleaceae bacterium]|nr:site-2 protease family protein [Defluviitaleaceae bacterium]
MIFVRILFALASIFIHEWAHVLVIRFLGGRVDKVGFFPLGMLAKARRLEYLNTWERYIIYAAGPLANLLIAMWAFLTSHMSYIGVVWLDELAFVNLTLALFNLLPALPLDGGRLALQFLGNSMGILRAGRIVLRIGWGMSIGLILLGIVQVVLFPPNITLLCAGEFLRRKTRNFQPELQAEFHRAIEGKHTPQRARLLPTKKRNLLSNITVKQAMEYLQFDSFMIFYVNAKKEYPLTEKTLLKYAFEGGMHISVGDILSNTCDTNL